MCDTLSSIYHKKNLNKNKNLFTKYGTVTVNLYSNNSTINYYTKHKYQNLEFFPSLFNLLF